MFAVDTGAFDITTWSDWIPFVSNNIFKNISTVGEAGDDDDNDGEPWPNNEEEAAPDDDDANAIPFLLK